jgi:ABC-type transport system substrate-binding protein
VTGSSRASSRARSPRARRTLPVRLAGLALLPVLVAGCLSFDQPTPSPVVVSPTPVASVGASAPPADDDTLVVGIRSDPSAVLPPASDAGAELLSQLLFDPLYRLGPDLAPVPALAASQPLVTGGGLSWSIPLARPDLVFQDGTPLGASDVVFSLELARAPSCSLGRDLCDTVARYLDTAIAPEPDRVAITLTEPSMPFLAEVLGRLPIVSEAAVRGAAAEIQAAAAGTDPAAPDALVARIAEATNADACLSDAPPFGCRLADHGAELEQALTAVGVSIPSRTIWTDPTGVVDEESYAGALLDRVAALGRVLGGEEMDGLAATLALIDPVARPFGSGPFRLEALRPGQGASLVANPSHVAGPPGIERIELRVVPDDAVAATLLRTGELDWLPEAGTDQAEVLGTTEGIVAARHALPLQRTIVFNTRAGHPYADARVRQAFDRCLDRVTLVDAATGGAAIPALGWSAPGSWAFPEGTSRARDVGAATSLLEAAGWTIGEDGIRIKGGTRLTSEVAIRSSRTDLMAFAQAAAESLRDCGIELVVTELDLTGGLLVRQLQWPNPFDTVLISRPLGVDPDADMEAYASDHATSEENPADANPGGYASETVDGLLAQARVMVAPAARADLYRQVDTALDTDLPAWPIWYDTALAAISDRVRDAAGVAIDPSGARYAWDLASWSLRPRN